MLGLAAVVVLRIPAGHPEQARVVEETAAPPLVVEMARQAREPVVVGHSKQHQATAVLA